MINRKKFGYYRTIGSVYIALRPCSSAIEDSFYSYHNRKENTYACIYKDVEEIAYIVVNRFNAIYFMFSTLKE